MSGEAVPRRLVAIVAADVVGYSRLMGEDQALTLRRVKAARAEVVDPRLAAYGGRVIATAGDSWLAEFASAVDATRCAIEIQEAMHTLAAADPAERRLLYRIGINVGDVIVDGDQIYGDGVNVAARLESTAPPGGILIAASVREQLHGSGLEPTLEDRGAQAFKNIGHPVHTFRVVTAHGSAQPRARRFGPLRVSSRPRVFAGLALAALVAAGVVFTIVQRGAAVPDAAPAPAAAGRETGDERRAVAVMTFVNQTGDGGQDYLSEGLTEDIAAALGRFPSLLVMAPSATRAHRGTSQSLAEVASALKVRYVVEGSIRRGPDRLRIGAQLTDAERGTLLWSEHYDVGAAEAGAIPDSIVRTIAGLLAARLEHVEREDALRKPERSLAAYDRVLRARHHIRQPDRAGHIQARKLLQEALVEDPDSTDARLVMAHVLSNYAQFGYTDSPAQMLDEAESLVRWVIERRPRDPRAQAMLGRLLVIRGQYPDALRAIDAAITLNPSDQESLRARAYVFIYTGRFEDGLAALEATRRFDPALDTGSVVAEGLAYLLTGAPERARQAVEASPVRDSQFFLQAVLAMAYAELGRDAEAAEAAARVWRLAPFFDAAAFGSRFEKAADRERLAALLRKAGLGETQVRRRTG